MSEIWLGGKRLTEFRVADLRAELDRRGLDTSGIKVILFDRLVQAIQTSSNNGEAGQTTSGVGSQGNNDATLVNQVKIKVEPVDEPKKDVQLTKPSCLDVTEPSTVENTAMELGVVVVKEEKMVLEEVTQQSEVAMTSTTPLIDSDVNSISIEGDQLGSEPEKKTLEAMDTNEMNVLGESEPSEAADREAEADVTEKISNELAEDSNQIEDQTTDKDAETSGLNSSQDLSSSTLTASETSTADTSIDEGQNQPITEKENDEDVEGLQQNSILIVVKGLHSSTKAHDIREIFRPYGKITGVKIILNTRLSTSGVVRRFAHVHMVCAEGAAKAVKELNNTQLQGRTITVEKTNVIKSSSSSMPEQHGKEESSRTSQKRRNSDIEKIRENSKPSSVSSKDRRSSQPDIIETRGLSKETPDGGEVAKESSNVEEGARPRNSKRDISPPHGCRGDDRPRGYGRRGFGRPRNYYRNEVVDRVPRNVRTRDYDRERHASPGYSRGRGYYHRRVNYSPVSSRYHHRGERHPSSRTDLTFDKIRAAREAERERENERKRRERERGRRDEIEKQRARNALEFQALEREKERLRVERERVERDKLELIRLERERQRIERERIEQEREELRRAQLKIEQARQNALKRSYPEGKERSLRARLDYPEKKPHLVGSHHFMESGLPAEFSSSTHRSREPDRRVVSARAFTPVRDAPMRDAPARDKTPRSWERERERERDHSSRDKTNRSSESHRPKAAPVPPKISLSKEERRNTSRSSHEASLFAGSRHSGIAGTSSDMSRSSGITSSKERMRYVDPTKSDTTYVNRDDVFMKRQNSAYVSTFPYLPGQGPSTSRDSWGASRKPAWNDTDRQSHEEIPTRWVSASGSTLAGVRTGMPVAPPPPQGIFSQHGAEIMYGHSSGAYDQFDLYKQNQRRY